MQSVCQSQRRPLHRNELEKGDQEKNMKRNYTCGGSSPLLSVTMGEGRDEGLSHMSSASSPSGGGTDRMREWDSEKGDGVQISQIYADVIFEWPHGRKEGNEVNYNDMQCDGEGAIHI